MTSSQQEQLNLPALTNDSNKRAHIHLLSANRKFEKKSAGQNKKPKTSARYKKRRPQRFEKRRARTEQPSRPCYYWPGGESQTLHTHQRVMKRKALGTSKMLQKSSYDGGGQLWSHSPSSGYPNIICPRQLVSFVA